MPSISIPQAYLNLANPSDHRVKDFWLWPVFSELTNSYIPPHDNSSLQNPNANLTVSLVDACQTFCKKYWAMNDSQRGKYINRKASDQDFIGRQTWRSSILSMMRTSKMEGKIIAVLKEEGCDPRAIMQDDKSSEVQKVMHSSYII